MTEKTRHYSHGELRAVFFRKYLTLARAAVDPRLRKPRMNAGLIAEIVAEYEALYRLPEFAPPPRRIFMLWQQGWDAAPELVRRCAESWREQNPGWELHLLDETAVAERASRYREFVTPNARRPARSNLARISLLLEHGGVWADATLFCVRPLDDWLPRVMQAGYFMFANPRPYRPSDNWFIAAQAGAPILVALRNLFAQYWAWVSRPHIYFWMHYLLEYLTETDASAAETWREMPKIPARGPLILSNYAFDKTAPKQVFDLIASRTIPVVKLSHKWRFEGSLAGTPLGVLTGLEKL